MIAIEDSLISSDIDSLCFPATVDELQWQNNRRFSMTGLWKYRS